MFLSSFEDSTNYHRNLQQQNFDSIAVIMAGLIIGGWFYPFYEKKTGKPMKLALKFAIGSFLGTLGMVCK
jgi:dipeptide/tripeptide permease